MTHRMIGQERLEFLASEKSPSPLEELSRLVDWTETATQLKGVHASAKGEAAWPPLAMFKALLLAVWYDLSDVKLAEALDDRASFRRFCGFSRNKATKVEYLKEPEGRYDRSVYLPSSNAQVERPPKQLDRLVTATEDLRSLGITLKIVSLQLIGAIGRSELFACLGPEGLLVQLASVAQVARTIRHGSPLSAPSSPR